MRVNAPGSGWHDEDLRAAARANPDAVVVPKVNSADDVRAVDRALDLGGADGDTAIWAMIETPTGVLRAAEIATAAERLTALVLGTNDLAKELGAASVPGRAPLLGALSSCVLAARAAGRSVLDGVYNDVRDAEGFEAECVQARQFGFDGKTLIHPGQIEICHRVFTPSDDEVAHARAVIEAFERAAAEGRGVVTVNGSMIENLHVQQARRTLTLAETPTP